MGGVLFFLLVYYYSHSGYLVYGERLHLIPSPPTSPIRPCSHTYHPPVFLSSIVSAFGVPGLLLCRSNQPGHPHGEENFPHYRVWLGQARHTRIKIGRGGVFFFLLVNYYSHSRYLIYGERPHQSRPRHTSAADLPHPSLHSSRCAAFCAHPAVTFIILPSSYHPLWGPRSVIM